MKRILMIIDGAADFPIAALGGKTPLEAARTPHIDALSRGGTVGLAKTIPDGASPGTDTAMLALFGHDMSTFGRGALEAYGLGRPLDLSLDYMRANLVTFDDNGSIISHNAGEITPEEAQSLADELLRDEVLMDQLRDAGGSLIPGEGFRQFMSVEGSFPGLPEPHNVIGQPMPRPDENWAKVLDALSEKLRRSKVNDVRKSKGLYTADALWPWGRGPLPKLPSFTQRYGAGGATVSAVPLVRGVCRLAGLEAPKIPGATGDLHTDWRAKVDATVAQEAEVVLLHLEAPDECAHEGDLEGKLKAIEIADAMMGALVASLNRQNQPWRLMMMPDHYTPLSTRGHDATPVPFALCASSGIQGMGLTLSEKDARTAGQMLPPGGVFDLLMKD